ncbi:cytochrome aa3 quinol oxidase subunit III [Ferroacidibacillus organovorans]|uniref:Quinol oxidase subunit 3 n=2 Tax=Ferroacidibacillus organovorans TaxID=1765683 RepID=A0A117SXV7_9BACL|nr:cytochrome aa3 quinol oxidase subunit III [Ferroacidibacillus organovorans]KUO95956.1 cytochrome o ubiquinol oxidase subunit III [Ferroacidibacillus organovorans]KYP79968.1 cytochrome o ubiquinol oxidase subunit III [Ferroacidibacillus organovorans]OAG92881.1 cytochrome o ubiquinol oxidase subunit III [Ferroacidibacillus organovorans]OPG16020.1 cytochrome aa3 quinol oxidase subunit III [Ferroacidibacillus organovorans]
MAYSIPSDDHEHAIDTSGPLEYSTEENKLKILGFWVFLGAEFVLFSCLFATYIVLHGNTAGGPTSQQLYDVNGFMTETMLLLVSSFTSGLAIHAMRNNQKNQMIVWWIITMGLGAGFVGMEISEFVHYVSIGATISRSAFLSGFFTLVGTHGAHVTLGFFWMLSILIQIIRKGITPITARKAFVVSLYWHFLDVVWIFIFTVVYLTGKVV